MTEISKAYEPREVEGKWYARWEEAGWFRADADSPRPAYSIVIPPPNVTGMLTLGHVLNNTIQDILARRARMLGYEVLWLPGTDHAGIATQTVVERTLKKEGKIKHRDDLGREKFLEKVWEWKEKHGGIIIDQLKKLGASCDWSRERFTMDEAYSRCVQRVFVDLYGKGLIYRGKRMVNWCPVSRTALSDEEVVMKEQNGLLYYFKVEVAEHPGTFLEIATTRPETIPGDTAVAVNPDDRRYAHLIGKHAIRPLPPEMPHVDRWIPIVGDAQVDFEFGTGVLKVTPAHDMADFEIGRRHDLAAIEVIDEGGRMNAEAGGGLAGLDRFEARKVAVGLLKDAGLLVREEPYKNNVGFSERADVPIEPRLSEQWFLKYPGQEAARAVVADGRMKFHPGRWAKVYDHWMENLQDWCISRQLWWGHRIPVWYHNATGAVHCAEQPPENPENWTQDPDVLDTWFSSWLWPFATMGWPDQTRTLAKFYPTTDLVTAPDIIFFWVARMIMAGYEYMGDAARVLDDALPFRNVYFTGIIRDKQGRKMSKSLGNSPDPLDLIGQFGADALRFGVMRSAPLGQDILFDEKNVELGRNFCTKLWNAARFRQMQGGGSFEAEIDAKLLGGDDKWILLRLDTAIRDISAALDDYRFSDAAQGLHRFFWSEYCDWYLEAAKAALQGDDPARRANVLAVMDFVLGHALRLLHPFLPFITEELWQGMGFNHELPARQGGETINFANWPDAFDADFMAHYGLMPEDEVAGEARYETVRIGRGLRSDFKLPSNKKVRFVLKPGKGVALAPGELRVLEILLNAGPLELAQAGFAPPKGTPAALTPMGELFLPLDGVIDPAAERERVTREISRIGADLLKTKQKLHNEKFLQGAPEEVVEEHRQRVAAFEEKLGKLEKMLATLD